MLSSDERDIIMLESFSLNNTETTYVTLEQ